MEEIGGISAAVQRLNLHGVALFMFHFKRIKMEKRLSRRDSYRPPSSRLACAGAHAKTSPLPRGSWAYWHGEGVQLEGNSCPLIVCPRKGLENAAILSNAEELYRQWQNRSLDAPHTHIEIVEVASRCIKKKKNVSRLTSSL